MIRPKSVVALLATVGLSLGCLSAGTAAARTAPSALRAQGSELSSAEIRFHTLDEDKDGDTYIFVTAKNGAGKTIVLGEGTFGQWDNDEYSPLIPLEVTREDAFGNQRGGVVRIRIQPVGHDTWSFTFHLYLHYTGGEEVDVYQQQRVAVNQDFPDWETLIG